MSRFFLSRSEIDFETGTVTIRGADAHHIAYALRMAVGDPLTVCDMQKTEYACTIVSITPDTVLLHIEQSLPSDTELPVEVCLYQSLPKGDKMDYIVQKAVELGVCSVVPVASARCIVKLDEKHAGAKCERWQRIAAEAAKQCGRGIIPKVEMPMSYKHAVSAAKEADAAIFCYEGDGTVSLKSILENIRTEMSETGKTPYRIAFFIGPEGGYDTAEVGLAADAGFPCANLGKRILRCETASGAVLASMIYAFEL